MAPFRLSAREVLLWQEPASIPGRGHEAINGWQRSAAFGVLKHAAPSNLDRVRRRQMRIVVDRDKCTGLGMCALVPVTIIFSTGPLI